MERCETVRSAGKHWLVAPENYAEGAFSPSNLRQMPPPRPSDPRVYNQWRSHTGQGVTPKLRLAAYCHLGLPKDGASSSGDAAA